jgi:hypothetical protein
MNQSQATPIPSETLAPIVSIPEMSTLVFQKPLSWQDRVTIELLLDRYRGDVGAFGTVESDDRVTLMIPKVIRRISWGD